MSEERVYRFESSDKRIFEMTDEDVDQSPILTRMVERNDEGVVPINRINGGILERVVKWLQMHRINTPTTSTWPEDYLKSMDDETFDMFMWASEYLMIHSVLLQSGNEVRRRSEVRRSMEVERMFGAGEVVERRIERDNIVLRIQRRIHEIRLSL
ncbi:unnamed protein product [Caenorhabditis brenneri]